MSFSTVNCPGEGRRSGRSDKHDDTAASSVSQFGEARHYHPKYSISSGSSLISQVSCDMDWTKQLLEYRKNRANKNRKNKNIRARQGETSSNRVTAIDEEDKNDCESMTQSLSMLNLEGPRSNSVNSVATVDSSDTMSSTFFSQSDIEMSCETGNLLLTETEMAEIRLLNDDNSEKAQTSENSTDNTAVPAHTGQTETAIRAKNEVEDEETNMSENSGNDASTSGNGNTEITENDRFIVNSPIANIIRTRFRHDLSNENENGNDIVNALHRRRINFGGATTFNNHNENNNDNNNNNNNTVINNRNTSDINNNNNNDNNRIGNGWDNDTSGMVSYDADKTELLSTLYNYMKISEMDRYGIEIFDKGLKSVVNQLSESDFQSLATSYWCNGIHFECMVKYRGTKIANNKTLKLPVSATLMDQAVTGGASVNKIKALLLQKRRDMKSVKASKKQEVDFFRRNCHIRFWNHEVLVRSFLENGWLTPEIAQIGLDKFLTHIFDRAVRIKGRKPQNNSGKAFGYPTEDDRDTILNRNGNTRDLDPINFSEKTLHRWCCLIEILCSRGAKCSKNKFKGIGQLDKSAVQGKNTWWIISSSVAKKNDLLVSVCALTLPSDLWNLISGYF